MTTKTVTASAPGRVNLIGEHTDYNGGYVLPMAIPQRTTISLKVTGGKQVRLRSRNIPEPAAAFNYELGCEAPSGSWGDYIQGVTRLLAGEGHALQGFEAHISSDIPVGSGLSSSAALEVSAMRALRDAFGLDLDDLTIARLGQRVENEFVGAHVGIMDQMASSLASNSEALFIDTLDLSYKNVRLPDDVDLVVINSGVSHSNSNGDYNTRRAECEQACKILGVKLLREIACGEISRIEALPEPLRRRARHVVTENERVLQAVQAISKGDLQGLGKLFYQSHQSMRDDYVVSVPEIDLLVELAMAEPEVYGARLTGGGFGGSIVLLARLGAGARISEKIANAYAKKVSYKPTILVKGKGELNATESH
ncbi:MAG: galactokinase [Elusimicrobiota bacterium]